MHVHTTPILLQSAETKQPCFLANVYGLKCLRGKVLRKWHYNIVHLNSRFHTLLLLKAAWVEIWGNSVTGLPKSCQHYHDFLLPPCCYGNRVELGTSDCWCCEWLSWAVRSSPKDTHTGSGRCVMGCHPVLEGFDSGVSMHVEQCVCVCVAGRHAAGAEGGVYQTSGAIIMTRSWTTIKLLQVSTSWPAAHLCLCVWEHLDGRSFIWQHPICSPVSLSILLYHPFISFTVRKSLI